MIEKELSEAILVVDEAYLVAVKRMGSLDALSREFAREHSERLGKQLITSPGVNDQAGRAARTELIVVLILAELFIYYVLIPKSGPAGEPCRALRTQPTIAVP